MAYMSEEGYKKLMAELKELETVERPKISAAIAEARDKGDLSENAEYDAAKEAQGMLEMRINKLKTVIADAKIIDESKLKTDSVQILNKVELKNVKNAMLEFFFVYMTILNKRRKNIMAYMSEEGYKKLMAELKELETVERPKISAAIAEARDKGDLSENAEYDAAKEAQGMLEMRINKLKTVIADAKIIDESKLKTDSVQILNKVELKNVKNGMKMTYTIVSESEANLKEGKISVNTPIAQGLLGKKVGDIAEITVPQGKIALEVVNISI